MRHRWLIYMLIGLAFGIADWYFLDLLSGIGRDPVLNDRLLQAPGFIPNLAVALIVLLNYGVWLIPVIPAAIFEVKRSGKLKWAALSAVIVWSCAMLSYYAYYAYQLFFVGLPNLESVLLSNRNSASYWTDAGPLVQRVILDQFAEWIVIAVAAGAIVGTMSGFLYQKARRKKPVLIEA